MKPYHRLKRVIVDDVLGVHDTPHRVAWGVSLGFFIGWTPTLGLQIVLYVAIASLLRANKVSGIAPLFISNVFTAAPLYYFCWWVGALLLNGGVGGGGKAKVAAMGSLDGLSLFSLEFWSRAADVMVSLGVELWFGSLVLGVLNAVPAYFFTRWLLNRRQRRGLSDADTPGDTSSVDVG